MNNKRVIETQITNDLYVESWHDTDFAIFIEEAINFGDVTRYLNIDQARELHGALTAHLKRVSVLDRREEKQ